MGLMMILKLLIIFVFKITVADIYFVKWPTLKATAIERKSKINEKKIRVFKK